jgi:hypothetical protein
VSGLVGLPGRRVPVHLDTVHDLQFRLVYTAPAIDPHPSAFFDILIVYEEMRALRLWITAISSASGGDRYTDFLTG